MNPTSRNAGQVTSLIVNGRSYAWPSRSTVVICFDGCDPAYLDSARKKKAIPAIERMMQDGFAATALADPLRNFDIFSVALNGMEA